MHTDLRLTHSTLQIAELVCLLWFTADYLVAASFHTHRHGHFEWFRQWKQLLIGGLLLAGLIGNIIAMTITSTFFIRGVIRPCYVILSNRKLLRVSN